MELGFKTLVVETEERFPWDSTLLLGLAMERTVFGLTLGSRAVLNLPIGIKLGGVQQQ